MVNPVTSKSHFAQCIVPNCCCCVTLRAGTLTIGILHLVFGILWLISSATAAGSYAGFLSVIVEVIAGILCIVGVTKGSPRFLWYAIYLMIAMCIWMVIFTIIAFVSLAWGAGVGAIVNLIVMIYFISVVRSFTFELEAGPTAAAPTV